MKDDIAYLHTHNAHIATFEKLTKDIHSSMNVRHDVQEHLLAEAMAGGLTTDLQERVREAMLKASDTGARVVVCTCSSIGAAAENSLSDKSIPALRIDRAMADKAVRSADNILVLAALESTLAPTKTLLNQSIQSAGTDPQLSFRIVEGAWPSFQQDNLEDYYDSIQNYVLKEGDAYDCIVLAQASMAPVADRLEEHMNILASPKLGVISACDLANT